MVCVTGGADVRAAPPGGSIRLRTAHEGDRGEREITVLASRHGWSLRCRALETTTGRTDWQSTLTLRAGSGRRWVLGTQRGIGHLGGVGWTGALARRPAALDVRQGTGARSNGISLWIPGRVPWAIGFVRDTAASGFARVRWRSIELGTRTGPEGGGSLAWSRSTPPTTRVELVLERRVARFRAGVGGGSAPAGALATVRAVPGSSPEWTVAAGVRAAAGRWQGSRAETRMVRQGEVNRSSVAIALRAQVRSWRGEFRFRRRHRAGVPSPAAVRVASVRSFAVGWRTRIALERRGDPGRWGGEASLTRTVGRMRGGARLELPPTGGRAGALWLERVTRTRVRLEVLWRRRGPVRAELVVGERWGGG